MQSNQKKPAVTYFKLLYPHCSHVCIQSTRDIAPLFTPICGGTWRVAVNRNNVQLGVLFKDFHGR